MIKMFVTTFGSWISLHCMSSSLTTTVIISYVLLHERYNLMPLMAFFIAVHTSIMLFQCHVALCLASWMARPPCPPPLNPSLTSGSHFVTRVSHHSTDAWPTWPMTVVCYLHATSIVSHRQSCRPKLIHNLRWNNNYLSIYSLVYVGGCFACLSCVYQWTSLFFFAF